MPTLYIIKGESYNHFDEEGHQSSSYTKTPSTSNKETHRPPPPPPATAAVASPSPFPMKVFLLLLLLQCILLPPWLATSLSPDGLSLLALKSAVDVDFPYAGEPFPDWKLYDADPCNWSGVACEVIEGFPRVVSVAVTGMGLRGYIPSELGSLVYLRRLNLRGNCFSGPIPSQLFHATALRYLFLSDNNFTGLVPAAVCSLPHLQNLDLSRNALSGEFPFAFADCWQLQRLLLAGNWLSGHLPFGIWKKLVNLVELDLSNNHFAGPIPPDLGKVRSLFGALNLSFNQLSGEIPKSLGEMPATVRLDLRNNNLTGEIPQSASFAAQGPTAFLGNPGLCGFPLHNPCAAASPPSSPSPVSQARRDGGGERKKGLTPAQIALITVADAAGVAAAGLAVVYICYRKKNDIGGCRICKKNDRLGGEKRACWPWKEKLRNNSSDAESSEKSRDNDRRSAAATGAPGELVAMDKGFKVELEELLRASAYVVGKSGRGIVYKVVVGGGEAVAVRRLGEGSGGGYKEFAAEVEAIGKVRHPNMVRMRAYYWAADEKLIVSEYIPNGNLSDALHGKAGEPSRSLPWLTRLGIARGIACGLSHLHECSPRKYVHGDIKPTNVLLDENFTPYISNFGLNRLISLTTAAAPVTTSLRLVGGTMSSYRSPEARLPGARPAQKWDIYSFGLILLELLTGRSPAALTSASSSEGTAELVRWARKGFEEERPLSEMVDPALLLEVQAKEEVLSAFHIALECTETDPELRPRMRTVSENLERIGGH